MNRATYQIGFLILLMFCAANIGAVEMNKDEVIDRILEVATTNEQAMSDYGFDAQMLIRWLNGDGETKKTELREYKTNWDTNPPHMELALVDHHEPDPKQLQDDRKAAADFQKSTGSKTPVGTCRLPFTWRQLRDRYNFELDQTDKSAAYVLTFTPKQEDLPERSRLEKVLNHLSGKIWADDQFRMLRLDGYLGSGVSFGFGLAKVKELHLTYKQAMHDNLMLPASLNLNVRVQALFFYSDRRQISADFSNYRSRDVEFARRNPVQVAPAEEEARADERSFNHP